MSFSYHFKLPAAKSASGSQTRQGRRGNWLGGALDPSTSVVFETVSRATVRWWS